MVTVREVMTTNVKCAKEHITLQEAAQQMRDLNVGMLPVCGDDDKLKGVITDRDIVVKCVAEGRDPRQVEARELAQGRPIMVDVNDTIDAVTAAMAEHQIRRVLVLEDRKLAGVISQKDLAESLEPAELGETTASVVSEEPENIPMGQTEPADVNKPMAQDRSKDPYGLAAP